jgi:hypothetical protein
VVIINNGWQGMVRQWQESFYGERYSASEMTGGMPNFSALAEAFGVRGIDITDRNRLHQDLQEALSHPGPVVVNVRVRRNENCYPMVPPGASNAQMVGLPSHPELAIDTTRDCGSCGATTESAHLPQLRGEALTSPAVLRGLLPCLLAMLLMCTLAPAPAEAAEVLQVRGATLLQVGDQNRSYPVRLGCVQVDPADGAAATAWLREALPRRTRVNLRPLAPCWLGSPSCQAASIWARGCNRPVWPARWTRRRHRRAARPQLPWRADEHQPHSQGDRASAEPAARRCLSCRRHLDGGSRCRQPPPGLHPGRRARRSGPVHPAAA